MSGSAATVLLPFSCIAVLSFNVNVPLIAILPFDRVGFTSTRSEGVDIIIERLSPIFFSAWALTTLAGAGSGALAGAFVVLVVLLRGRPITGLSVLGITRVELNRIAPQ